MTDEQHVGEHASEQPLPPHVEQAYRRLSRRAMLLMSVIVIVVLVAAGFIGSSAITRRLKAAREIDRATRLLEQADTIVLDIDEVIRAEASPVMAERARALLDKMPSTVSDLKEVERLIDDAMGKVTEDEQRKSVLLRAAASARLEMLEPAKPVLDANVKAGLALEPAQDGWGIVLAAEKLADQSVREYNKLTTESVRRSSNLAAQAARELSRSRPYFSQAATAFPEAGFDRYLAFVDAKIALLALSRRSNSAWIAGKIPEANADIKKYNAQEKVAVALARALPAGALFRP